MHDFITFIASFFENHFSYYFFLIVFLFLVLLIGFIFGKLQEKVIMHNRIKKERQDAIKKSRAVLAGQLCEQVAPFLPNFPCSHDDVRFIGKPIDFIGFSGMSSETGEIKEIVFIEVKTGNSTLSKREQEIRTAIEQKRVRYVEYRIEDV